MNFNAHIVAHEWDKNFSRDELRARLVLLTAKARQSLPILDDDDLEAAIDEAADRLTSD